MSKEARMTAQVTTAPEGGASPCWIKRVASLALLALSLGAIPPAMATETVTYYATNAQGTVVATMDSQGNATYTAAYRPYGKQAQGTPQAGPGYTGHVNDPDTGLVYMQQRYYDPDVGGFISPDPVSPTPGNIYNFNRYAYANNNPYRYTDPDGRIVRFATSGAKKVIEEAAASSSLVNVEYGMLKNSSKVWIVKYQHVSIRDGGQSHVEPNSVHDARSKSAGGTGKGTGGTIYINKRQESVKVADSSGGAARITPVTKGEVISHEFAHAIHDDEGKASKGSQEEHNARSTEDAYRQEQGFKGKRNWVEKNP